MKKKKIGLIIIAIMMLSTLFVLTGCGNEKTNESNETNQEQSNKQTNSTEYNYNLFGISVNIPEGLEFTNIDYKYCIWEGNISTDDTIYFATDQFCSYYAFYDSYDSDSFKDAPDIMNSFFVDIIDNFYPAGTANTTISVDSEKEVEMLGYNFIRRTGTVHAEKLDESTELSYAAYYGIIDLPEGDFTNTPVIWVAFSKCDDDKTKLDLENIVDNVKNKAYFIEK